MVRYLAWKKIKALLNIQRYQRGPQAGILGKGCENFVVRIAPRERKFHKSSCFLSVLFIAIYSEVLGSCVCACVFSVTESYPVPCSSTNCPTRLLYPWRFLGKIIGVSCHFLLQGIFLTQESTCISCFSCIGGWILYQCTTKDLLLNECLLDEWWGPECKLESRFLW